MYPLFSQFHNLCFPVPELMCRALDVRGYSSAFAEKTRHIEGCGNRIQKRPYCIDYHYREAAEDLNGLAS
jgi:hypothetical protein